MKTPSKAEAEEIAKAWPALQQWLTSQGIDRGHWIPFLAHCCGREINYASKNPVQRQAGCELSSVLLTITAHDDKSY
jgi:hypothetical protein